MSPTTPKKPLRTRQRLGKYRIEALLARGGFADVFRAYDTIEGIRVALKVPQPELLDPAVLADFQKEVRLTARLNHPNILPIKNADFIDDRFVVVCHLGEGTLGDRLQRRLSPARGLDFAEQILSALAHAHAHRVIHCDVKPENFIRFGDLLRLADFGISRIAFRTMHASGSGTVGFMAPEQALGRPSLRSDVFAAGLLIYRMFAGVVPEWPFEWPPPGYERAQRKLHPDFLDVLRRSLEVDASRRFADAQRMLDAFRAVRGRALKNGTPRRNGKKRESGPDWRELQVRQFTRTHRRSLEAVHDCKRCGKPVSEAMQACPWCGSARKTHRQETRYPAACPRCKRGVKLDWRFCPWCYGGAVGPLSNRSYSDRRYSAKCSATSCRGDLMPFMRYCPWCRIKVRRAWRIEGSPHRCGRCRWGVLPDYWNACPWCTKAIPTHGSRRRGARR
jgi:serine/threonine-protein kinase